MDSLDAKIVKQVEYYFSDVNLSRDKFMKETMMGNDGWIPFETMLKFNRLKSLSEDIEKIKSALLTSQSDMLEVGEKGIRRNPAHTIPETVDEVFEKFKDRSVYVKGFDADSTLDEIIEWLEKHGGKTINVHMRRYPDSKKFKGSIFAIFENKDDVEKLLNSEEASKYKGTDTLRRYREDYLKMKQEEKDAKAKARAEKAAVVEAGQRDHVTSRMVTGAILEICGLPANNKERQPTSNGSATPSTQEDEKEPTVDAEDGSGGLTVMALKQWLADKLGTDYPIAWIDVEPSAGKALIRFKTANTAEPAWDKLKKAFDDKPVVYCNSELTGRILSGDEEFDHWKSVVAAQHQKANKRRGARGGGGGGAYKKRRMN